MKSMTGYAFCGSNDGSLVVEVRGHNSRFLDLSVIVPPFLSVLETVIRQYFSKRFKRGAIEVKIDVKNSQEQVTIALNAPLLSAYKEAFDSAAQLWGQKIDFAALVPFLVNAGIFSVEIARDDEQYRGQLTQIIAQAAEMFELERIREGKHIESSIFAQLDTVEKEISTVNAHIPEAEKILTDTIRARAADLKQTLVLDENRLLTETAILLTKWSISEEIQRISAHCTEFRAEAAKEQCSGKKLDFLCQEIHREINTIGSKIPLLAVSKAVIAMKEAVETIREQLRNVE
ncbi:MAG: YicC family protein [Treponema sp.]|jgi:uncharacterized protein (TIGR00255 family)|nr:YicC family protein [Treponema sp.]